MAQVCKFIPDNSDYELIIAADGQLISTRKDSGFEFLFKSAKANFGIKRGQYQYEVKIIEFIQTDNYYGPGHKAKQEFTKNIFTDGGQNHKHIIRAGFTYHNNSKIIGQDGNSCGIDNFGNRFYAAQKKKFFDEGLQVGDVIRCCIDLTTNNHHVSFYKNGKYLGLCFDIPPNRRDKGWYPMISVRNACVEVNFGGLNNQEFYPIIQETEEKLQEEQQEENKEDESNKEKKDNENDNNGLPKLPPTQAVQNVNQNYDNSGYKPEITEFKFFNFSTEDLREYYQQAQLSDSPKLIMLVGLPGSGKTTFAEQYVQKYQNTILISTQSIFNHIIENIKISQVSQKIILLMELCDEIFIKSMKLTALTTKDIIIDQCNVMLRSRLEKLSYFKHHQYEAVVLVTSNLEQERRILRKQQRSEKYQPKISPLAIKSLKQNFVIPTETEGFYRIHYFEIDIELSRKVVLLGKEISELQIHPLLRPKNFKVIDEFKAKYNLTTNYADFEFIKRQEEEQIRQAQLKEQQERIEQEKLLQKDQNTEEQNTDQQKKENQEQNQEQTIQQEKNQSAENNQTTEQNQTNKDQENQNQEHNSQEVQPKQTENKLQPQVIGVPPPSDKDQVVSIKRQNPEVVQDNEQTPQIPTLPQQPPKNNKVQDKIHQKYDHKTQLNFNRLEDRSSHQFPYSNQPQHYGHPPGQTQQFYPPPQPQMQMYPQKFNYQQQPPPFYPQQPYQQDPYYQQGQMPQQYPPQQPYYPPQQPYRQDYPPYNQNNGGYYSQR